MITAGSVFDMNQKVINAIVGAIATGAAAFAVHVNDKTMSEAELHDTFTPTIHVEKETNGLREVDAKQSADIAELQRVHRMDVGHAHDEQIENLQ